MNSHASATMPAMLGFSGFHLNSERIRSPAATSIGGSPGRLGASSLGISIPVTSLAAAITSRTENPLPLPRMLAHRPVMLASSGELRIAEGTVKFHINNILGKLEVSDRTQAVTEAIKRGIVRLG